MSDLGILAALCLVLHPLWRAPARRWWRDALLLLVILFELLRTRLLGFSVSTAARPYFLDICGVEIGWFIGSIAFLTLPIVARTQLTHKDPWVRWGWMILTILSLLAFRTHPLDTLTPSFLPWATLFALPLFALNPGNQQRAFKTCVRLMTGVAFVALFIHLVTIRRYVGSVDFFYYVSYARDMFCGNLASDNCYKYFPGVYTFWRGAYLAGANTLSSLQRCYIGVLLLNAWFLFAVIWRTTQKTKWGIFAAIWYLIAAERFQGFGGTTGPIATLPLLWAIMLWRGSPLRGKEGWHCTGLLGVGIGLSLYTRQQAGLLSLGAAALLLNVSLRVGSTSKRDDNKHSPLLLGLLPLASLATFLVAILTEGRGWEIIRTGLSTVAGYTSRQSPLQNLYVQLRADEISWCVFLLAGFVWLLTCWAGKATDTKRINVAGVCLVAGAATLIQFASRPYGHYMLLGLPFLVIAATLLLGPLVERLWQSDFSIQRRWLLVCLLALPLVHSKQRDNAIQLWRLSAPPATAFARSHWHLRDDVKADLRKLPQYVTRGETMYVYPPRHNSPYFLTGARGIAETGYGFIAPDLAKLPYAELKWILVVTIQGLDDTDGAEFTRGPALLAKAQQQGFSVVAKLPTMILLSRHQRTEPSSVK